MKNTPLFWSSIAWGLFISICVVVLARRVEKLELAEFGITPTFEAQLITTPDYQLGYGEGFEDGMQALSLINLECSITGTHMNFGQMAELARQRRSTNSVLTFSEANVIELNIECNHGNSQRRFLGSADSANIAFQCGCQLIVKAERGLKQ